VVKDFDLAEGKTKVLVAELAKLELVKAILITAEPNEKLVLASRNIPYIDVCTTADLNPLDLVAHDKVVMTVAAIKQVEEMLA
jgi:large subunit ribosomal protein L4